MKNAVILHGTFDNPRKNWFQWLKKELVKRGYKTWVPMLPNSDKPNPHNYNPYLLGKWNFNEDTVMIGHSSGATAIINLLNSTSAHFRINKAIMVAGFKDDLDWDPTRELFPDKWDFTRIVPKASKFILIHSDNDSYVSAEHADYFKKHLGDKAVLKIMKGQKHFSVSGSPEYKQFPELLKFV